MAPHCQVGLQPEVEDVDLEDPVFEAGGEDDHDLTRDDSTDSLGSTASGLSVDSQLKLGERSQRKQEKLKRFLQAHNFSEDVNLPQARRRWRSSSKTTFISEEIVYPVHVAARLGDADLLRLLIKAGANLHQKTSKGRTAADMARDRDVHGSHDHVLGILLGEIKVSGVRDFMFESSMEEGEGSAILRSASAGSRAGSFGSGSGSLSARYLQSREEYFKPTSSQTLCPPAHHGINKPLFLQVNALRLERA
mmetsp:Transcript_24697/g.57340  ORF Transcript_24697/g.57340 Transcript_24697/m.57340 type:complete len:250 (+) Transcript_24697:57-806(+)